MRLGMVVAVGGEPDGVGTDQDDVYMMVYLVHIIFNN